MVSTVKAIILSIILLIGFSALEVSSMSFTLAQTGTTINGTINSDTVWTAAKSPYNLTAPLTVENSATLTVEAGVTINLNGYALEVNGTIAIWGTAANPVKINKELWPLMAPLQAVGITFDSSSISWNSQTSSGSLIDNAVGNGLVILVNGSSPLIAQTSGLSIDVYGGSPLIYGNTPNGIYVDGGSPIITNNTIEGYVGTQAADYNWGVYLDGTNTAMLSDNTFVGSFNTQGAIVVASGSPTIERNLIEGNPYDPSRSGIGIAVYSASPTIENNTFSQLAIGLNIYYDSQSNPPTSPPSPTVVGNNFYNNSKYNVYLGQLTGVYGLIAPDVAASGNWWGTSNISAINQTIYDHKNNPNVGVVTFEPALAAPNPAAAPNPTPITSIINSSAAPSPSVPELSWLALLPLLTATFAIVLTKIRKQPKLKTHYT